MTMQEEADRAIELVKRMRNPKHIAKRLLENGFKLEGCGSFKTAFVKGNIVVKVNGICVYKVNQKGEMRSYSADDYERNKESPEAWVSYYKSAPKQFRRFLAKPLAHTKHVLVQPKLSFKAPKGKPQLPKNFEIALQRMDAWDWQGNYGYNRQGNPVMYDGRLWYNGR